MNSEKIIGDPKMRYNNDAIKLFILPSLRKQYLSFLYCFLYSYCPWSSLDYFWCWFFASSPLRVRKSDINCCRNSWKSDNYIGSNTKKKPLIETNRKHEPKSLRATSLWEAITNAILWKGTKWQCINIIPYFGGTNNIFVDCNEQRTPSN